MPFEPDLRAYLERIEREPTAASPVRQIDEHELRRHLLARLREMDHPRLSTTVEQLFRTWSSQLSSFARHLEILPPQLAPLDPQEAIAFARRALDAALDCLDPNAPLVDRLELGRIVREFETGEARLSGYALETHLVHRQHRRAPRLTELGRVFLRLRGKDALRWLITCEVAQSTGPNDPWHAGRMLLEDAVSPQGIQRQSLEGELYFPYHEQTLDRLANLEMLSAMVDDPVDGEVYEYRAAPDMRDTLLAALEPGPWHTAVRALLEDERALVLPSASSGAAEATIEQTKLIVHEVRNALIPVRHDIDALRAFAAEHAQQERIDTAKQGIARVLDFVEAMAQMSELITEPVARHEIGTVVDEAVGWVDASRRVVRVASTQAVQVIVPRVRFARAISNVVGNALQVTTAGQPVRVSIAHGPGVVRVVVDDGGPGIAVEHRARVFLEGVTMRPDGTGSGFGLAFARRVVEGALHGKIWCEGSDLGGARFVIEVPEPSPG